VNKLKIDYFRR